MAVIRYPPAVYDVLSDMYNSFPLNFTGSDDNMLGEAIWYGCVDGIPKRGSDGDWLL